MKKFYLTIPLLILIINPFTVHNSEGKSDNETITTDYSEVTISIWQDMTDVDRSKFMSDRFNKIKIWLENNESIKVDCVVKSLDPQNENDFVTALDAKIHSIPESQRRNTKVQIIMANLLINELCSIEALLKEEPIPDWIYHADASSRKLSLNAIEFANSNIPFYETSILDIRNNLEELVGIKKQYENLTIHLSDGRSVYLDENSGYLYLGDTSKWNYLEDNFINEAKIRHKEIGDKVITKEKLINLINYEESLHAGLKRMINSLKDLIYTRRKARSTKAKEADFTNVELYLLKKYNISID